MTRSSLLSLPALLASLSLGAACGDDPAPSGPPPTTTDPTCAEGQVLDGGTCVPAACGVGTWGDLPMDADAVYVDAGAADGGDGSQQAPVRGLQVGADVAATSGLSSVRVAAGTYFENLQLGEHHAGLEVVGRCAELVVVDGGNADEIPMVVEVDAPGEVISLRGLTLTAGPEGGLVVWGGEVHLDGVGFDANQMVGLVAVGGGASIEGVGLTIQGTQPAADGSWGRGMHVEGGAEVTLRESVLSANSEFGLHAGGSQVTLEAVEILGTLPDSSDELGIGMFVVAGASLAATDLTLSGNHELGLYLDSATMDLTDCVISDTQARADGARGLGAWVEGEALLRAERCEFANNRAIGVYGFESGTEITLVDSVISDTQEASGDAEGLGIRIEGGAHLAVEGGELRDNTAAGIYAKDEGTTVEVSGLSIRGTAATEAGLDGVGLQIDYGASLTAEDLVLDGNHRGGLDVRGTGATATVRGCTITGTAPDIDVYGAGISVSEGGALVASDCWISGTRGAGLLAYGGDTSVDLSGLVVSDTVEVPSLTTARGVEIADGATLTMTGSELTGNQGIGLLVVGAGASAWLEETTIQTTVQYSDGQGGRGLGVESGASVVGSALTIADTQSIGAFASGEGASLDLTDSVIRGTEPSDQSVLAFGLFAQNGAIVAATDVELRENEGPGLYSTSEGTLLSCEGCVITGNQFAGAAVTGDGRLELVGVDINDTLPHGSEGGGVGVFSLDHYSFTPSLLLQDSAVGVHTYAAVWLTVPGDYQIVGNDLTGGPGQDPYDWVHLHGDAVYVTGGIAPWDESTQTGLLLADNTLRESSGAAIFLDGASATLRDNVVVDNDTDLVQQRCDDISLVPEAQRAGLSVVEICPDQNRSTVALDFALVLMETEAED
ncbi:right-handed parallel beta-helix repeat-containing protein [Myxococcota bacterium]|nr:right-handed parallel beta-helix repeat-containing protein [Myxococcota bacterium]